MIPTRHLDYIIQLTIEVLELFIDILKTTQN